MSTKKIITGAALGTLIGSLAVAIYPRRHAIMSKISAQGNDLTENAKHYANKLVDSSMCLARLREKPKVDNSIY